MAKWSSSIHKMPVLTQVLVLEQSPITHLMLVSIELGAFEFHLIHSEMSPKGGGTPCILLWVCKPSAELSFSLPHRVALCITDCMWMSQGSPAQASQWPAAKTLQHHRFMMESKRFLVARRATRDPVSQSLEIKCVYSHVGRVRGLCHRWFHGDFCL